MGEDRNERRQNFSHVVCPGTGIGGVNLGMTKEDVLRRLGSPSEEELEAYPNEMVDILWKYESIGLTVQFTQEVDYQVGILYSDSVQTSLEGVMVVGLDEASLCASDFGTLGRVRKEDDFGESGRYYEFENDCGVSFWVDDTGRVVSVDVSE